MLSVEAKNEADFSEPTLAKHVFSGDEPTVGAFESSIAGTDSAEREVDLIKVAEIHPSLLRVVGKDYIPTPVLVSGAPLLWHQGFKGKGIIVGVIDTGIDANHPDLRANVGIQRDYVGGFGTRLHMHGTHVAGTIAANGVMKGMAPDATLYDYRVFDSSGRSRHGAIPQAIREAVDDGCHVINMSLRSPDSLQLEKAVQYAKDNDVLIVAAAGNDSENVDWRHHREVYPASYAGVMSVAAVDFNLKTGKIDITNTKFSNRNTKIDICADGYEVYSTVPGGRKYGHSTGTSMACPHVAGAAALLLNKAQYMMSSGLNLGGVSSVSAAEVSGEDAESKTEDQAGVAPQKAAPRKVAGPTVSGSSLANVNAPLKLDAYSLVKTGAVPVHVGDLEGADEKYDPVTGGGFFTCYPAIPAWNNDETALVLPEIKVETELL